MNARSTAAIFVAAVFLAAGLTAVAGPIPIGSGIPSADVSMKSVDGSSVTIADVAGEKGTLVVFTCNACPWAKAWEDRIVALGNEYRQKGVGAIAINPNDPNKVAEDSYEVMKERAEAKGVARGTLTRIPRRDGEGRPVGGNPPQ